MAGSVNRVIIVGNLGRDPEIRFTQAGKKVANFSLATSESWRDRQSGERKERTEWHRVVVFNEGLADIVEKYVKQGSKLYIEGHLRTRKWQGQDGKDNYTTEVVLEGFNSNMTMLDKLEGGQDSGQSSSGGGSDAGWGSGETGYNPNATPDLNDEIPFN